MFENPGWPCPPDADTHGQVAHLYHSAQQKLRYGTVKNRLRNAQKRLYFDLTIANFLQRLGGSPMTSSGRERAPCWIFKTLLK